MIVLIIKKMTSQFTMNDLNTSFNTGFKFNAEDQLNEEMIDKKDKVTLRYLSRKKDKGFTIIENFAKGLSSDSLAEFIQNIKKKLNVTCVAINSNTKKSIKKKALKELDNYNDIIIQLQGNNIKKIQNILKDIYDYSEDDIIIRG